MPLKKEEPAEAAAGGPGFTVLCRPSPISLLPSPRRSSFGHPLVPSHLF